MPSFTKDPHAVRKFHIVWCDRTGLNDGSSADLGDLQSATISTSTWFVPAGITKDSANNSELIVQGITYAENTSSTIWLSAGALGKDYDLVNRITTSDSETLDKTITIKVRET